MAELEQVETVGNPIGERLKTARESQGQSLDDIAAKTRVPIRHLLHIEKGEWDELPAATYTLGFARAYAQAVGLNPAEISAELRSQLTSTQTPTPAYYEPADPARVPPKWLTLLAALIAIVLVVGYFVWQSDFLDGEEAPVAESEAAAPTASAEPAANKQATAPPSVPATPTGPVVLTATDEVWLRVYEADGPRLFESTLKPGDRYDVPATAKRPQIRTGRPDALNVTVGSTPVAPLGPAETTVADVSLLPADLLARGSAQAPAPTAPAPQAPPATTP